MSSDKYSPVVKDLIHKIYSTSSWADDFKNAISNAHKSAPDALNEYGIVDLDSFFNFIERHLKWIPSMEDPRNGMSQRMTIFYFIFDQKSVLQYQTPSEPSTAAGPLSWLSDWLVRYANEIGRFMDEPQSLTEESLESYYKNPDYHMTDYLEPRGGWKTFNQFFARSLKPGVRPIAEPSNPVVVVSPADSTFDGWADINDGKITFPDGSSTIELKGITWDISELLRGSQYADAFKNGTFMHMFLSSKNYHREHAPVAGEVVEAFKIQGQVYQEIALDKKKRPYLVRPLPLPGAGDVLDSTVPVGRDRAGYQWCQMRGLVVLKTEGFGLVAVLPIGMAQVSSVMLTAQKGVTLAKGEELSYFQFGGSDIVVVFEKRVTFSAERNIPYRVGEKIGTFRQ
ncbi:hypothetical protein ETB97_008979 [Aspergillus alliaceus]|uniref:Phosphatidylserine decarboxylase n=1 Tax=Petromyces alliaceus TaxID=209559 RepID=A0A8H6E173_PETAA|nr:hypothetical protein ETB97_008979 [Aspergillus burnettii]